MKIINALFAAALALITACTTTAPNPDETVILETVTHEDFTQGNSVLSLDPECESGDYDYVVRSLWPTTPDNAGVNLVLRSNSSLEDIVLVEYEVHACRAFNLAGGSFWFHSMDGFTEEEGDPRDSTGIIVGETRYGHWIHRFHDFSLKVDGNVVGSLPEFIEMTVSDTEGSAAWFEMNFPMNPGDVHTFAFSASVRKDNAPSGQSHFSVDYSTVVAGKPSPNPFGRVTPWGLEIAYPTIVTLY